LNDIPTKPIYESTPRNQSDAHEDENSVNDLFENESNTSEPSKKRELPRPPLRIEKTPTPQQSRKPSAELRMFDFISIFVFIFYLFSS
jgi:hypothetical protein